MCLTVKEVIAELQRYPDDMKVKLETNKRSDIMSPLVAIWGEVDDTDDNNLSHVILSYS